MRTKDETQAMMFVAEQRYNSRTTCGDWNAAVATALQWAMGEDIDPLCRDEGDDDAYDELD